MDSDRVFEGEKKEELHTMNCTPKVRQKKSNFWGAVHCLISFFN